MCTCVKCKLEKERKKKKAATKRRLIHIQSETTNHHTVIHTEKKWMLVERTLITTQMRDDHVFTA